MIYVRFKGSTPYPKTDYETYLVFDDLTDKCIIEKESRETALDNARTCRFILEDLMSELSSSERNAFYLDYLQGCVNRASWEPISEAEFNKALGIEDPNLGS